MEAMTIEVDRRRAVAQMLASWRLEGFEPDVAYLASLEDYASARLTLAELRARTDRVARKLDVAKEQARGGGRA